LTFFGQEKFNLDTVVARSAGSEELHANPHPTGGKVLIRVNRDGLYVLDLERAREFYEHFFAAAVGGKYHDVRTGIESYFLSFDEGSRLELMTRLGLLEGEPAQEAEWNDLAISTGSAAAVDDLTRQLALAGYPASSRPRTTGDGYYECVVPDPEGNLIEITI